MTCASSHKGTPAAKGAELWLPKDAFVSVLPSLLAHTPPLAATDGERAYSMCAYYSDSVHGIDWNGFARAAAEHR